MREVVTIATTLSVSDPSGTVRLADGCRLLRAASARCALSTRAHSWARGRPAGRTQRRKNPSFCDNVGDAPRTAWHVPTSVAATCSETDAGSHRKGRF